MTKLYRQAGDSLTLIAPAGGVVSGTGYVIGNLFVVAEGTAAAGELFVGNAEGMHNLAHQATEGMTAGQIAYWDDTLKTVRNATAAGRFIIGAVPDAVGASDALAPVRLNGVHVVAIP